MYEIIQRNAIDAKWWKKNDLLFIEAFYQTNGVHCEEWKMQNYINYAKHSQIHEGNE
jgi:hypothetical protein